jgi:hypothetical protein
MYYCWVISKMLTVAWLAADVWIARLLTVEYKVSPVAAWFVLFVGVCTVCWGVSKMSTVAWLTADVPNACLLTVEYKVSLARTLFVLFVGGFVLYYLLGD